MSMPRAAMSVATSTRYLPRLKSASARVRCACERSPWMRSAAHVVAFEQCGQPVGARFGARERDRAVDRVVFEQFEQQIALAGLADGIDRLGDAFGRCGFALQFDAHRIAQHLFGERGDFGRNRRREEQRLAFGRNHLEHAANDRQKAHVEHPVGLVEHEDTRSS